MAQDTFFKVSFSDDSDRVRRRASPDILAAAGLSAHLIVDKASTAPTLYHVPRTISSPLVQVLLELKVCPDKVAVKTLTFADLKKPIYLSINPMGTAPTFKHGSLEFWETNAILAHLLETYDPDHTLHPAPGTENRPQYLFMVAFVLTTVYPFMAGLFLSTLKPEVDQEALARGKAKWIEVIAPVLVDRLGRGPFLFGDSLCAADLVLAKPLGNANALQLLDGFPALKGLHTRLSELPTFEAAYRAEGPGDGVSKPAGGG